MLIIAETGDLDLLDDGVLQVPAPRLKYWGTLQPDGVWVLPTYCAAPDLRMELEHMYLNFYCVLVCELRES